jgi:hypothetical protein
MHSGKTDQIIDQPIDFEYPVDKDGFAMFKIFLHMDDAAELTSLLEKHAIEYRLIDNAYAVDITIIGKNEQRNIQVMAKADDFSKINDLLEKEADQLITALSADHYLYSFTEEELREVIIKRDEWSTLDYRLAKKILLGKGIEIDEAKANRDRIEELSQPVGGHWIQISLGYICAVAGGLIGILIGWFLWKSTKTLPNGEKIFMYAETQRSHGKIIFMVSAVTLPLYTIIILLLQFNPERLYG